MGLAWIHRCHLWRFGLKPAWGAEVCALSFLNPRVSVKSAVGFWLRLSHAVLFVTLEPDDLVADVRQGMTLAIIFHGVKSTFFGYRHVA